MCYAMNPSDVLFDEDKPISCATAHFSHEPVYDKAELAIRKDELIVPALLRWYLTCELQTPFEQCKVVS